MAGNQTRLQAYFRTYHLDAQDDDWKEEIIQRADEIKNLNARSQQRAE